jgi:hypothetical protein
MRKTIAKSIGIGSMLILSIAIVILGYYATIVPEYPDNEDRYNGSNDSTQYVIDTVEVIQEDGIRWYTLDTFYRPHRKCGYGIK